MKWTYAEIYDWCALYVDGQLKWQGHPGDMEWVWWLSQGLPTELRHVDLQRTPFESQLQAQRRGRFPVTEAELPAERN